MPRLWYTDRAHNECQGTSPAKDVVYAVRRLIPELGTRKRRGLPRDAEKVDRSHYFVGRCYACGDVRLLAYPPREQLALRLQNDDERDRPALGFDGDEE